MTKAALMTGAGDLPRSGQATTAGGVECLTKLVRDQDRLDVSGQAVECDVWRAGCARIWRRGAVVMTR
jgi:FixJ family two-component response regulator